MRKLFQCSALRALKKLKSPQGWPIGGDWCQKYVPETTKRQGPPTRKTATHQGIFSKFPERHNKKTKNFQYENCFPFQEMFRVLKPGAKISFLDYVQLPAYNASDAKHNELLLKALFLWQFGEGLVGEEGGVDFLILFDWTCSRYPSLSCFVLARLIHFDVTTWFCFLCWLFAPLRWKQTRSHTQHYVFFLGFILFKLDMFIYIYIYCI